MTCLQQETTLATVAAPTAPDPDPDPHLRMSISGRCHRKCNNAFWLCIMPSRLPYLWFCWVSNVDKVRKSAPRKSLVMLIFFHSRNNWNFFCHMLLQVTKYMDIPCQNNVVCKRLIRVCFKKFLKTLILEKLLLDANLQVKFQFDFTTRINEAITVRINQKVAAIALT